MPVCSSWKDIYRIEYFQMQDEGYDVSSLPNGDDTSPLPFHLAENCLPAEENRHWKEAYEQLISLRGNGLRKDFTYTEPDQYEEIMRLAEPEPVYEQLTKEEYRDRIYGAWYGRCAAVMLGKPLEMGMDRLKIKEYLESVGQYPLNDWVEPYSEKLNIRLREDCIPSSKGHIQYMQSDDDIHYTICSLLLAEQHGENFTEWNAGQNLLDNITYNWVWTADKYLYQQLVNVDTEEEYNSLLEKEGPAGNPWRESMCPQLKSDLWGYITPGEMRRGSKMIYRLGRLSASKNGLYGGLFMQGCVSAALTKNPTVDTILQGGLSNIPKTSRLYEAVHRVMAWYAESHNWIEVCDKIYDIYGKWYFAGAINNICFIVLALLEGQLDFSRTICTAVMCGTDTDCNSGNAGSIVAAAIGYSKLPKQWIEPMNNTVKSAVAGYGFGQISDLAERTLAVFDSLHR